MCGVESGSAMSFSGEVKKELGRQIGKSRHCQIAELAAIFLMEGRMSEDPLSLSLATDKTVVIGKYNKLLRLAFGIQEQEFIRGEDAERVKGALKLANTAGAKANGLLLQRTCCRRAFLRGAFLASGSMSDPGKSYHFEIVCRDDAQAAQLVELMGGFSLEAKVVERKNRPVVYLKEGSQIVDMLKVMEAYVSLMDLENVRILKEMRNSVNRKVNCETANINKTVSAAVRQVEEITKIRDCMGLDKLPENLRQIALLRLEYPELPLKDLASMSDPPVGKSGVNHRLRKLSQIAGEL